MKYALAAALLLSLSIPAFAADAVPDAAAAEKIADAALKLKLGHDGYLSYMRDLSWEATLQDDSWWAMPVVPANLGMDPRLLDGWIVQVDQRDGRVLGVYLQF